VVKLWSASEIDRYNGKSGSSQLFVVEVARCPVVVAPGAAVHIDDNSFYFGM
tara:strand:+ start:178 stop:333 length:156 start_codon:yes stop_codon:yes gene_type:complete